MSLRPKDALALLGICLAVRLPWLYWGPGAGFDLQSYSAAASTPLSELYSSAQTLGRYPYLPLWAITLKVMARLQAWLGADLEFWSRVPALAGDYAVALLLPVLALRQGATLNAARALGALWCLHPLVWMVSAAHGQFESLPLACLLAALGWHLYGQRPSKYRWSALSLGLAIAFKTWPLVLLPLFALSVPPNKRVRFVAWALLPGLLLLSPWFLAQPFKDWAPRLAYGGVAAIGLPGACRSALFAGGLSPAFYRSFESSCSTVLLLFLAFWLLAVAWRSSDLKRGLLASTLLLLLLAPGLSPQSLLWALPFCLLTGPARGLGWASAALAGLFYALFLPEVLQLPFAVAPDLSRGLHWAWALLNLLWWAYALVHLRRAWRALR